MARVSNLTTRHLQTLRHLAIRPLTVIDMADDELKIVQDLVRRSLARDYAEFKGRRIPVRLRIWGISPAGRAILEQQSLVDASTRRQQLSLITLSPPPVKPKTRPVGRIKPLIRSDPSSKPFKE